MGNECKGMHNRQQRFELSSKTRQGVQVIDLLNDYTLLK